MLRFLTFLVTFFWIQVLTVYGSISTPYNVSVSWTNCSPSPVITYSNGLKYINDFVSLPTISSGNFSCSRKGYYDGIWWAVTSKGLNYACPADRYVGAIRDYGATYQVLCMLEDSLDPTVSNISYTAWRRNTDLTLTVQAQDNAMLDRVDIYEFRSWSWVLLHSWSSIWGGSTLATYTYTKTVENGLDTKYFVRAYDRVWQYLDSAIGWDVHFDIDAPTNLSVNYNTWWRNSPVTVTYQAKDARNLKRMELWENDWTSWGMVDFYDNLNAVNSLTQKTWIRSAVEWVTYSYKIIAYDATGNQSIYTSPWILRFDITPPTDSDITLSPSPSQPLLATDSQFISIPVSVNGWSPIDIVDAQFEKWATPNTYFPTTSWAAPLVLNVSVQNVDLNRWANGWRSYGLKVLRVCDQAWNCLNNPFWWVAKQYNVYANTNTLNQAWASKDVILNQLNQAWSVADATTKILRISLKDRFWNALVSAPWINRTIDFTFDVTNRLYLDQYLRSWTWGVLSTLANDSNFQSRFPIGDSVQQIFTNETSSDGLYNYDFKIYSPTHQNTLADPLGQFDIQDIKLNVSWVLGSLTDELIVNSSNIDFDFAPLYATTLTWEVRTNWFIEWTVSSNTLWISKAISWVTPTSRNIYLEFGSWSRQVHPVYKLKFWSTATPNSLATEWHQADINNVSQFINWFVESSSNPLYVKLLRKNGALPQVTRSYLSTHISYVLNWNRVVYNSDIIWKPNYFDDIITDNSNQSWVKIIWISASKKKSEISQNQFSQDVALLWNVYKTTLKKNIISNVYGLIKSISPSNGTKTITDLTTFASNIPWKKLVNNTVLYFGWLNGDRVDLWDGDEQIDGVKTIVVIGGDLYIKNNMYYQDKSQDMLWVIILKDENGKGWNLYIDPSVSNIVGTYIMDKSVISYDGTNEFDWNTSQDALKNQLHIFGNLFSENTLGWSRATPVKCPYYSTGCTQDEAQKYDLNYLRRYVLNTQGVPVWWWKVIGWGTCTDIITKSCVWWNASFARNILNVGTDPYAKYSVVIEYNPLISKLAPPLFSSSKK